MTKYYKSLIKKAISNTNDILYIIMLNTDQKTIETKPDYKCKGEKEIVKYLYDCYFEDKTINLPEINEILNANFNHRFAVDCFDGRYNKAAEIIFEVVEDTNGRKFAKEYMTGILFPMIGIEDLDVTNSFHFSNVMNYETTTYETLKKGTVHLDRKYKLKDKFYSKLEYIIDKTEIEIASKNDLEAYKIDFEKNMAKKKNLFNKKANKKGFLIFLNHENVFDSDIIIAEAKARKKQEKDSLTMTMDNIEFLLYKLGQINKNLQEEKEQQYYELLNNEIKNGETGILLTNPLTIGSLKSLEAELEFLIRFQKTAGEDIIKYLDSLIAQYDDNEKTPITIDDIDNLYDVFLKTKDKYEIKTQRKALMNLSLLYIYEIYENKDDMEFDDLEDSYFHDSLKTIVINLSLMIDQGIIEPFIIDLNNLNPNYIYSLINNIKFIKDKEKIKNFTT